MGIRTRILCRRHVRPTVRRLTIVVAIVSQEILGDVCAEMLGSSLAIDYISIFGPTVSPSNVVFILDANHHLIHLG